MLESHSAVKTNQLVKIQLPKENFGLTKSEFLKYIDNLKAGDDSFITNIMAKQLPESMTYLKNKFQITHEKAYDTCLDTFLVFRTKLINNKISYGNLRFLFTRMCINQYIDEQKKKKKVDSSIQEFLKTKNDKPTLQEPFFDKLDKVINELDQVQKSLIRELYYSNKSMHLIAEEQSISYASLRKKKERILKKIKSHFFEGLNFEN